MNCETVNKMQGPIVVRPQPPRNLTNLKGCAIAQLVIGILAVILGIAARACLSSYTWTTVTGTGIWAGMWIVLTGIIGMRSIGNYIGNTNSNLTRCLVFNIISICLSGLAGLFAMMAVALFAKAICYVDDGWRYDITISNTISQYPISNSTATIGRYNYRDIGLGINIPLLVVLILNCFVSILSVVYCCRSGGGNFQGQVAIQQPAVVTTTGASQLPRQPGPQYGEQMAPQYGIYVQPQYPPQQANFAQYPPQQPYVTQYPTQQPNITQYPLQHTNVTQYPTQQLNISQYSSQQPNITQYPLQQANVTQYPPQQTSVAYPEKPPEYSIEGSKDN